MSRVSAQVSLYPLRQQDISPAIDEALEILARYDLRLEPGRMSTLITGDADATFKALQAAFIHSARTGEVVMVVTISNACPMNEPQESTT
jgi:uncharacterized protein YqgV (UPF0045/DUF77 family)